MDGIQITNNGTLEAITKKETFDSVDSVKIKIKKALLTPEDFLSFEGDPSVRYPIVPARSAIALVSELGSPVSPFSRGERIYPHPEIACGKCFECAEGDFSHCSDFAIAGKTSDGFLRDFAIMKAYDLSPLPSSITDNEALFLDYVALCVNVINAINFKRGEHVIIVGGDALGIILAQLVIYYQGVPILVDNSDENIIIAKNAGIYYTLFADNKIEKNVGDLTGARLSNKVVYMTGSNLNTDIALKLAGFNATVCFAGFSTPSIKVNFTPALAKSLKFKCVTNGYGSIDSAINLLAVKNAVNLGAFNVQSVKQDQAMAKIKEISKITKKVACSKMLIVEMS